MKHFNRNRRRICMACFVTAGLLIAGFVWARLTSPSRRGWGSGTERRYIYFTPNELGLAPTQSPLDRIQVGFECKTNGSVKAYGYLPLVVTYTLTAKACYCDSMSEPIVVMPDATPAAWDHPQIVLKKLEERFQEIRKQEAEEERARQNPGSTALPRGAPPPICWINLDHCYSDLIQSRKATAVYTRVPWDSVLYAANLSFRSWWTIAAAAALAAGGTYSLLANRQTSALNPCPNCGYDLHGLPHSTCPECGVAQQAT